MARVRARVEASRVLGRGGGTALNRSTILGWRAGPGTNVVATTIEASLTRVCFNVIALSSLLLEGVALETSSKLS